MLIHRIKLTNLLSFGPDSKELELGPLNVLIGPNGSGKSNFIDAIGLLKLTPEGLEEAIRKSGGIGDWLWRLVDGMPTHGELETVIEVLEGTPPLRHLLSLANEHNELVVKERVGEADRRSGFRSSGPQSVLSRLKDPVHYPQITHVGRAFERIRLYRDWSFGRGAQVQLPQEPDAPNNYLTENAANLGLVLNRLSLDAQIKQKILKALKELYEGITDFHVNIECGTVQVLLSEGGIPFPATRLSDGAMRYLSILAILCDPSPPPLVCLEQPEMGLHPDILPGLADLLREASERCQLIVTTHSDVLVDKLTDAPESIVVCEKHHGQTQLRRLQKDELAHWLKDYSLGTLWTKGELGGSRW